MGPYPKEGWTTKNGFLHALERKKFKDVFYFCLGNENFIISFSNSLPNFTTPQSKGIIDLDIAIISEKVPIINLIESIKPLLSKIEFDYGYGFVTEKPLGYSESNAKIRWYGVTSKPDPIEMKWAKESIKIDEGKIKHLYNFNLLSKKHHQNIIETISSLSANSISNFDNNLTLWTVDAQDKEKYRKDLSDHLILQSLTIDTST